MSALSDIQRARVNDLLDALLDLPAPKRERYLARQGSVEDPLVREEVASLLRATRKMGAFLTTSARVCAVEEQKETLFIDGWTVKRQIGRGGMGVVYEAERGNADFSQPTAIKLLRQDAIAELQRFNAERRILARLVHPNIARLYDGGIASDGRPYTVMELISGEPITEYCSRVQATLQQRMHLFLQVCDAVAYAHRNLVVHRDLKPSNILVTAEGQVKLLDFGVAKLLVCDEHVTQGLPLPLTPASAAPEQLLGGAITTATDVYSLGLLLFELLTGARPWAPAGEPIAHAMRVVLERDAPAPSEMPNTPIPAKRLRGDFDAIVAKSLRKEPAHRYGTVEALKQDVERALRGEAVAARANARLYNLGRLLRRYRWAVAAVAAIMLSLAVGLGIAEQERNKALRHAAREEAVRYQLTRLFRKSSGSPTAQAMLDASVQRVIRQYSDDPQLTGEVILTLADLYGALEDMEGAATLLEGYLKVGKDPASVADASQKYANVELARGNLQHADELLKTSEAFWATVPAQYAEERLEGLGIRARQQRAAGDIDNAIATTKMAIAQRLALSGRVNRETAVLYNSYGLALNSAHRYDDALAAYRETSAIYDALGLKDELDVQIVKANLGIVEMRTGHLQEAEATLQQAIQHQRALAGDSAAVAAAMGNYGRLLTLTNRATLAVPVLKEAVAIAEKYAGLDSPVAAQNRKFLTEAQNLLGSQPTELAK